MSNAEHKQAAQENIANLLASFVNGQINIAGRVLTLVRSGRYFIEVAGAKGTTYRIFTSPCAKVIEDNTLPVYSLAKGNRNVDFTYFDGNAIEITAE